MGLPKSRSYHGDSIEVILVHGRTYDIAVLRGDYVNVHDAPVTQQIIDKRRSIHDLVLDFEEVNKTDSSCLAAIIYILKNVRESRRNLYICGANPYLRHLCDIADISPMLDFRESLTELIESSSQASRKTAA